MFEKFHVSLKLVGEEEDKGLKCVELKEQKEPIPRNQMQVIAQLKEGQFILFLWPSVSSP